MTFMYIFEIFLLFTFQGVFDENTPTTRISTSSSPVILVVASYDSFTYVPDAKLGFNQFSSGAIGLLNIAKQLSEYFESNKEIRSVKLLVINF